MSITSTKALQPLTVDSCGVKDISALDVDMDTYDGELQHFNTDCEGTDSPNSITDFERETLKLQNQVADLGCISTGTSSKLAETERQLAVTQSKLVETERQLAVAQSKLAETEKQLADMQSKLADNERQFDNVQSNLTDTQSKLLQMQCKLADMERKLADSENMLKKSLFRMENIKGNDTLVKFYTGFNDYETLVAFYEEILESDAKVMRQWSGHRSECDYSDVKVGRTFKLPLQEQFFLTLVRLRLGLLEHDIAYRFDISQPSVSRITNTWINLMFHSFKSIETFPAWHVVKKYMPETFKKDYPNTRVIIDATEFSVERPSSLLSQACTYSAYKSRNTVKILIGVTPSGAISFVSEAYEGSISDRKLVEVSGLLAKLEPGDEIMADKGFTIQDMLVPYGVRLNMPPFLQSNSQMPANDIFVTKKIARLRVHVERAIGRVKDYRILRETLPASMWDSISDIIYVCCMLTNFGPPLVC